MAATEASHSEDALFAMEIKEEQDSDLEEVGNSLEDIDHQVEPQIKAVACRNKERMSAAERDKDDHEATETTVSTTEVKDIESRDGIGNETKSAKSTRKKSTSAKSTKAKSVNAKSVSAESAVSPMRRSLRQKRSVLEYVFLLNC